DQASSVASGVSDVGGCSTVGASGAYSVAKTSPRGASIQTAIAADVRGPTSEGRDPTFEGRSLSPVTSACRRNVSAFKRNSAASASKVETGTTSLLCASARP